MNQERRDFNKAMIFKVIAWITGVCLSLLVVISSLITFIYTSNASATNNNVAEIARDVKKLVSYNIANSGYIKNNEAKIEDLRVTMADMQKELRAYGEDIIVVCNNQKIYWTVHGCKER